MKSTLAIYDAMLEAKFPAAAARGVAEALERDMEAIVATKTDLQYLRAHLGGEIDGLKGEMRALRGETQALRGETQALRGETQALRGETQALRGDTQALNMDMQALKAEMNSRFAAVDARFERLELRLTVKLGAFLAIAVGLIVTLQQLLR